MTPIFASGEGLIGLMTLLMVVFLCVSIGAVFCRSSNAVKRSRGEWLVIGGLLLLVASFILFPLIKNHL